MGEVGIGVREKKSRMDFAENAFFRQGWSLQRNSGIAGLPRQGARQPEDALVCRVAGEAKEPKSP